ncbi:YsnF/AvaK domain-containing protein [Deinococcus arenicola]|uniref:DUF2382 domain-containing protein n=1 Tax=Deinococcus arenicola TaxID=2994950 RepID=A0ABU4DLB3_9DEIO|nr:DUF2382 domain-containing protein [Deinococcus sp. ZS9-10]MDV6373138.1 DUF2382 domain-containing protein [Deinococcus sp. ZS9-10]
MTDPRDQKLPPALPLTEREETTLRTSDLQLQGVIELREERLIVEKEREKTGSVAFTREVRRQTVQVPVDLVTEVLIIEYLADQDSTGAQTIVLDGVPLASGERRELVVYREEAYVEKRVVVHEQVRISKRQTIETRTFDATLAREELVVTPQGDVRVTEDGVRVVGDAPADGSL